jgi:hypothetical protein
LDECNDCRQHHSAGDPPKVWVQAQSHLNLLRDLRGANKAAT